ncbi:MAG: hypothetical protein IPI70_02685 [Nitrospira sp.]|nr:hypothetical protein [Nitrospira sp.]
MEPDTHSGTTRALIGRRTKRAEGAHEPTGDLSGKVEPMPARIEGVDLPRLARLMRALKKGSRRRLCRRAPSLAAGHE